MALKIKIGRLAAAIGIGVAVEALLFAGGLVISSPIKDPWSERVFALTQEPTYHVIEWLAKIQHPGFEEQAGYIIFVPFIQSILWSTVCYWLLSRRSPVRANL